MILVLAASSSALACPNCAINQRGGLGSWFMLATMIVFPFFVVAGVLFVGKKLSMFSPTPTSQDSR